MSDQFKIQSVNFNKTKVTLDDCFNYLCEYGFKVKNSYETETEYCFIQYNPTYLRVKGFSKKVIHDFIDGEIKLVYMYC